MKRLQMRSEVDGAWEEAAVKVNAVLWEELVKAGMGKSTLIAGLSDVDEEELGDELEGILGRQVTGFERTCFEQLVFRAQSFANSKRQRQCAVLADPSQLVEAISHDEQVFTIREVLLAHVTARSKAIPTAFPCASSKKAIPKDDQRKSLVLIIGKQLEACGMPIMQILAGSSAPERLLGRLGAGKRLGTLRQKVRVFRSMSLFMQAAHGKCFPSRPIELLDYVFERGLEPCGPSIPLSILSCVAFYEELGGRKVEDRIAGLSFVKALIGDLRLELVVTRGVVKKKASQFLSVTICSWELEVMDEGRTDPLRLLAWGKLVSVWAALRTSDKSGIPAERMRMICGNLIGDITTTKTTGAGKKVGCVCFAVSGDAWFLVDHWLKTGWQLFCKHLKPRPFFLPLPTKCGTFFSEQEPSYIQQVVSEKKLIAEAMGFEFKDWDNDGFAHWKFTKERILEAGAQNLWSGHSARCTLPTWAAAVGCSKDEVAYAGRWKPSDSAEYVRIANEVALKVQSKVASIHRQARGVDVLLEGDLLRRLGDFLVERGGDPMKTEEMLERVIELRYQVGTYGLEDLTLNEVEPGGLAWDGVEVPVGIEAEILEGQFFVSFSPAGRPMTLHQQGKCFRLPGIHVTRFTCLDPGEEKLGMYRRVCKDCFPKQRLGNVSGDCSEDSGSSEDSSTDTEATDSD